MRHMVCRWSYREWYVGVCMCVRVWCVIMWVGGHTENGTQGCACLCVCVCVWVVVCDASYGLQVVIQKMARCSCAVCV